MMRLESLTFILLGLHLVTSSVEKPLLFRVRELHREDRRDFRKPAAALAEQQPVHLRKLVKSSLELRPQVKSPYAQTAEREIHKGIVIAAGGAEQLASALATVQVIRLDRKCKLHIEVGYCGVEEANEKLILALEDLPAVSVTDVCAHSIPDYHHMPENKVGYFKKILTIYTSRFDQLLYLDADNMPLYDPTSIFDWPDFKKYGSIFWSDYMGAGRHESVKPEIYEAFNLQLPWADNPSWHCSETGQLVLDRRRHADVLEWIYFLNAHHEITYKYMYGDKDTFELAFALADKHSSYNRIKVTPRASFKFDQELEGYVHLAMLQNTALGEPIFFHRVAGGKYHLDNSEVPIPEFSSMSVSIFALNKMGWSEQKNAILLVSKSTIDPESVSCEQLDEHTVRILRKHDKSRWESCNAKPNVNGVPIPILRLEWFPKAITRSMLALAMRYRAIQIDRNE